MSARAADIELRLRRRKLRQDARQAEKELRASGKRLGGGLRSGFNQAVGGLSAFASLQGLADVGRDALGFEESLTRIGIQAKGKINLDTLRKETAATGQQLGISRSEVLNAASEIINLEGAAGFSAAKMNVLARASVATGAELSQLAGVGFALNNAFKLDNADALEGGFSAIIEAGKQGSVPLGEMTTVLQQIATQWARVGQQGKLGAAEIAAAIQVARKGFGSASEVGTGIKAFVGQLDQADRKLQAFGVKAFDKIDGKRQLKPIGEILDQMANSKLIDDPTLLQTVFGSAEARQFLRILVANREEYENLTKAAFDSNAVQEDSAAFLNSNAGRMRVAISSVRAEVEKLFTPARLEKFRRAAELAATAVGFVVDNLDSLLIALGALKAARASLAMVTLTDSANKLALGAKNASNSIGAVIKRAQGLGGKAKALGGVGLALASSAAAGWELGRALDNALGLSDALAGVSQVSESRTQFARKLRQQVEASDRAIEKAATFSGDVLGVDVKSTVERIQTGGNVTQRERRIVERALGGRILTAAERTSRLGEAEDIEREDSLARAEARNAQAANKFARDQEKIARRLFNEEFIRGDRTLSSDEVRKALDAADALAVATPTVTRGLTAEQRQRADELALAQADTENRERLDTMIALLREMNEKSGNRLTLELNGEKFASVSQNNPNQHRSPAK